SSSTGSRMSRSRSRARRAPMSMSISALLGCGGVGLREPLLEVGRWVELDLDLCGLDLGDGDLEPVRGPLRQLYRASPSVAAGLRAQRDLLGGADREDPRRVLEAVPGAQDHQAAAGPAEVAGLGQLPLHARGGQL